MYNIIFGNGYDARNSINMVTNCVCAIHRAFHSKTCTEHHHIRTHRCHRWRLDVGIVGRQHSAVAPSLTSLRGAVKRSGIEFVNRSASPRIDDD